MNFFHKNQTQNQIQTKNVLRSTSSFAKKSRSTLTPNSEIGDVRYDNMTKITIKQLLFWRLPYEM